MFNLENKVLKFIFQHLCTEHLHRDCIHQNDMYFPYLEVVSYFRTIDNAFTVDVVVIAGVTLLKSCCFFANNSVTIVSATIKADQNLVHMTF